MEAAGASDPPPPERVPVEKKLVDVDKLPRHSSCSAKASQPCKHKVECPGCSDLLLRSNMKGHIRNSCRRKNTLQLVEPLHASQGIMERAALGDAAAAELAAARKRQRLGGTFSIFSILYSFVADSFKFIFL